MARTKLKETERLEKLDSKGLNILFRKQELMLVKTVEESLKFPHFLGKNLISQLEGKKEREIRRQLGCPKPGR